MVHHDEPYLRLFDEFFNPIFGGFLTIVPTVLRERIDDLKADDKDRLMAWKFRRILGTSISYVIEQNVQFYLGFAH
jgi:hypothetical protein